MSYRLYLRKDAYVIKMTADFNYYIPISIINGVSFMVIVVIPRLPRLQIAATAQSIARGEHMRYLVFKLSEAI